jgi:hypothetical protein
VMGAVPGITYRMDRLPGVAVSCRCDPKLSYTRPDTLTGPLRGAPTGPTIQWKMIGVDMKQ